jgi:hypothetical protein
LLFELPFAAAPPPLDALLPLVPLPPLPIAAPPPTSTAVTTTAMSTFVVSLIQAPFVVARSTPLGPKNPRRAGEEFAKKTL